MKTAVSVPNDLFADVERLARRSHRTRSAVYSAALREYVARHDPDGITEALDRFVEQVSTTAVDADFAAEASRRVLEDAEW